MVIIELWKMEISIRFFCSTRTAGVVLWKNEIPLFLCSLIGIVNTLSYINSAYFSLLGFSQFQQVLLSHLLQQKVQVSTYFKQLKHVCLLSMLIT